jgi:hypothetical protein
LTFALPAGSNLSLRGRGLKRTRPKTYRYSVDP